MNNIYSMEPRLLILLKRYVRIETLAGICNMQAIQCGEKEYTSL